MKTFDTIAELALSKLQVGQFVNTGGNTTKGDGGGETYLVSSSGTAQGDITIANGNIAVLQRARFTRKFLTLAGAIAAKELQNGDSVEISERTTGNGGGGLWSVVLASSVTPDIYGVASSTGESTLALVLNAGEQSVKQLITDTYDGTADNTANILTWLGTLSATEKKVYKFDLNVVADLDQLISSVPVGDLIKLEYPRTGNNTGSFLEKQAGILTSDAVDNDTIWWNYSGHNSSRGMNNFRTSGTTSSIAGKATDIWALGQTVSKQARNMALTQWTEKGVGGVWEYTTRKLAPWESVEDINNMWEFWITAESVTIGDYRKGTNMYVAATTGTTGATKPTHSSGTVSDGGVDWTYVASGDATIHSLDEFGRVANNGSATDAVWNLRAMSIDDPSTVMNTQTESVGVSTKITYRNNPTNSGGTKTPTPFWEHDGDAVSTGIKRVSTGGFVFNVFDTKFQTVEEVDIQAEITQRSVTATDLDATPSVLGINTLTLTNTGATSITALDDGIQDQVVTLVATNGNTTLVNGGTLRLEGSVNLVMTAFTAVTVRRISNAITTGFIEIGRSVK